MEKEFDVIIVGGGPAGLRAAEKTAEKGLKVLLLEKDQEIGSPVRCGEGLGLGWFNRLGIEPKPEFAVQPMYGAVLYSPLGKELVVRFDRITGYIIERRIFEKHLAREAARKGARIIAKTTAIDVLKEGNQITGVKALIDGIETELKAKIVIAADGVESVIARKAGLDTTNSLYHVDSGYQYEMAGVKISHPDLIALYFTNNYAPRGYCLTGDTEIFARNTVKKISDVGIGEEVLTLDGWMPVSDVSEREYAGEIVSVTPTMLNKEAKLTADHLVYVWNKNNGFEWKKAKDLIETKKELRGKGDYLVFPIAEEKKQKFIDVSKYYEGIEKNGLIYPKGRNQFGKEFPYRHGIPRDLEFSEELMEFFGYYVSEGSINSNGVIIPNTDKKIIKRLMRIGKKVFGFQPNLWVQKRQEYSYKDCIQVNFGSKIVKKLTFSLFGKGSKEKHLPKFVYGLTNRQKLAFLKGCFRGDGSVFKSSEGLDVLSYTTSSKSLVYDLWYLLASMNIVAAVSHKKKKNSFQLRIRGKQLDKLSSIFGELNHGNAERNTGFLIKNNKVFLGIRKLNSEYFSGKVYDIQTTGSFCPFFAVHNCWIFPKGKDYANIGVGILGSDIKTAKKYLDEWLETQPELKNGSKIIVNAGCIPVGGFLDKMTLNGLIVVGDAAHQVNPIHGGGMGIAMEAADIAAEVIKEAFEKNDFSDKFLSQYTSKWYEKRGNKLKNILKKRKMLESISDKDFEVLVNSLSGEDVLKLAEGELIESAKILTKKLVKNPKLAMLMVKYLK